jgi:hypothetical protein
LNCENPGVSFAFRPVKVDVPLRLYVKLSPPLTPATAALAGAGWVAKMIATVAAISTIKRKIAIYTFLDITSSLPISSI